MTDETRGTIEDYDNANTIGELMRVLIQVTTTISGQLDEITDLLRAKEVE